MEIKNSIKMRTTKIIKATKTLILLLVVVMSLLAPSVSTTYAATEVQREDVLKNSPEHDGENDNLGICSADNPSGGGNSGAGNHEPGKVYLIGDSIGVGVSGPLTAALGTTEGWSLQSDSSEGRQLSEGVTAAANIPEDTKHVLIILGANTVNASKEQIQEMADATKGKSTYWLGLNLTRSDLVEPSKSFNDKLKTIENVNYIENGVAPPLPDGVHHSADGYNLLAQYIAGVLKGSSSDTTESGGSSNSTKDMTIRDKVAKLLFIRATTPEQIKAASDAKVGGIFVRNPGNANDSNLYNSIKTQATGTLIAVDFEGGRVQAPGPDITGDLPSAQEMGQLSEDQIKALGKDMGTKLAALGITMDFAPVVDIGGNNSAVIGDRAFANDPEGVTAKAGAFAEGLREAGITPVLKHFPGHGSKDGDSHAGPVATEPLATLEG
ncbi:MAG: beta-N-acetylhexosaminidase, partial [Patescibacteria group bacterium]|nr:beta-N-acetylhexosaminidase [Patescibacteria group bacterium]